jgi:hypothetical protein
MEPAMRITATKAGKIGWLKMKPSNVNVMIAVWLNFKAL